MTNIASENDHLYIVSGFSRRKNIVSFHGYVKFPSDKLWNITCFDGKTNTTMEHHYGQLCLFWTNMFLFFLFNIYISIEKTNYLYGPLSITMLVYPRV